MQAEKTRHMRASVISVLLAVLMIVTCIPSAFFASAAENAKASGPLVLTNSSIEFRDSKYNPIPDPEKGKEGVESGDLFYLMATISGNNVNEGEEDTYRIEITDQNIQAFSATAKKYGIDFALKKDTSGDIPRYLVFFKGRDADVITAAFREFSAKNLEKEKKPSIRKELEQAKQQSKAQHRQREKVKTKDRGVEL